MNAQQLKNSILQEAIEGRLVPQDPNDEPASVLLDKIRKEKARLVKEKKITFSKPEKACIIKEKGDFSLPQNWKWGMINDVCRVFGRIGFRGYTKNDLRYSQESAAISISPSNMINGTMDFSNCTYISEEKYEESPEIKIQNGDILIVKTGSSYGKTSLVENLPWKSTINPQIAVVKDVTIDKQFLVYFFQSPYAQSKFKEFVLGTSIPTFSQLNLISMQIPLPPLAEQKRIVAKIEELLPKVEEYGKAQEALDKLNEELPERLKKSILQEAIEGRLVPQDPNDEPASALLDKIRAEKKRLVKEGKLKKKDLEECPVSREEISFDIPSSWKWCHLGDIGIFERGNGIKRDETFDSGYPCVRYGEMYTKYRLSPTFEKTYSFTTSDVFEKCRKAHKGDLFMALTGENKQDISLAVQYVGEDEVAVGGDLCHFTILEAYALYFVYLINSKYFSSKKETLATGDIIVHISTDKLSSIAIPLPPLAEQKRIVEKIEQLLGEIDKLKK